MIATTMEGAMNASDVDVHLRKGRDAFERRAWREALLELSAADRLESLGLEDLRSLAVAAQLTAEDELAIDTWTRAHRMCLETNDALAAARCAFSLGMFLMHAGEMAAGGGWLARSQRIVEEHGEDCVEGGYLLVPAGLRALSSGGPEEALAMFVRAGEIAGRFDEADLRSLSTLGRGQALIDLDRVQEGVDLLDEAMISVMAGEVSTIISGIVYCACIATCRDIYDLSRATEWTSALVRWCDSQPDLKPFRGQCLVHRSEILQMHGSWGPALEEVRLAYDNLTQPRPHPAAGEAAYRRADLHRLRGEFAAAEASYQEAGRWGRSPHPGLALMRLAEGKVGPASVALRNALDEAAGGVGRAKILPAFVQVMLAAKDLPAARAGADELTEIATALDAPLLIAAAEHTQGQTSFDEGDLKEALGHLLKACDIWDGLDVPYEAARTRTLIGCVRRELGDEDTAGIEFEVARATFEGLGAEPDLESLQRTIGSGASGGRRGLTGREVEVLGLVATGRSNREIADRLVISEKTVARHVSNIFGKLGVTSRSGATAYAYQNDLI